MTKYDIKYIIRKILIYSGVAFVLMFVKSCDVKADSVCLNNQTQWLQSDYTLNSDSLDLEYFYGRPFNNCGEYVKVQIPVRFSKANINIDPSNVQYDTNYLSGQYRLDLSNGDSYYGRLVDGYLEFYVRAKIGDIVLFPKHLSLRLPVIGDTYMTISRYIQAYSIDSDNSNVVSSVNNVNNSINEVNNSINNDNVDNQQSSEFFINFDSNVDGSLVTLIKKPIDIVNSFYNTCEPIVFHIPKLDIDLTIPCISSINNGFTSVIFPIARIIINGLLCYRLILAFIDVINKLKDPNNSDLEVVDL